MSKGQTFLQKYIQRPLAGLVDAATLGYTDLDKKGDDKVQKGIKRGIAGFGDFVTGNQYDFDQKGTNAQIAAKEAAEFKQELENIDSYNRNQYNKDFRNMLITDSALRQYELGREADRNMRAAQQYFQMAGAGQESAARRRLMEDQFSPTKISQQRLRAQTGEAALMDAVARQGNTAVNIATAGLSPRGRAGGR